MTLGKFLKAEPVSSSLKRGEQQLPCGRAVVSSNTMTLAASCLALGKCLINIKCCCRHHHHHISSLLQGPLQKPVPGRLQQLHPEDNGRGWLRPISEGAGIVEGVLVMGRPSSSEKHGLSPRQAGPAGHCRGLDTAACPSAQGPGGRQGLGQWPWSRALTLGPSSPVSG